MGFNNNANETAVLKSMLFQLYVRTRSLYIDTCHQNLRMRSACYVYLVKLSTSIIFYKYEARNQILISWNVIIRTLRIRELIIWISKLRKEMIFSVM